MKTLANHEATAPGNLNLAVTLTQLEDGQYAVRTYAEYATRAEAEAGFRRHEYLLAADYNLAPKRLESGDA